jgi:molybdopterin molybdotransferase
VLVRQLGVAPLIEAIDQRPGRPMWFGVGPGGQAVFGLPGNPVATLVCLTRYVLPALAIAAGAHLRDPQRIALGAGVQGRGITQFVPVVIRAGADGASVGLPRPPNGSGDFLALAGTDGFVELPPRPEGHAAGVIADFYRW